MTARILKIVGLAAIAAGCGSDGATAPTSSTPIDVSSVVSQLLGTSFGTYPGVGTSTFGTMKVPAGPVVPSNCPYAAATQTFVCPEYTSAGITYNVSYYLYDAAGRPLSTPNGTIASIRTVMDFKGTLAETTSVASSYRVNGHGDMTMSGLNSDHRTMNGTTTMHDEAIVAAGSTATDVVDITVVTTNLDVPVGPSASYPKSGTIAIDLKDVVNAFPVIVANFTIREVITFNGTSKAAITVSFGNEPATKCTLDLVTGVSTCA